MRVSTSMQYQSHLNYLQTANTKVDQASTQYNTGLKFQTAGQDPGGMAAKIKYQADITAYERYGDNAKVGLCFLLAVQGERKATDVRLPDEEPLLGFRVGHDRQVECLLRTADERLLYAEVADRHHHLLFDAQFFLLRRGLGYAQVVLRHIVFAFPNSPVHQGDG